MDGQSPSMVGQTLGHYRIESKLGEGGMGAVWKARDTRLDRFVALKTLPPEKLADEERRRRFVQEAKAASALNHPNIVHIYDIADADAVPFIAMEYVAGKTLDQLIGRKGLRLNESLKYAIQIADALARTHSAGIIHRDLKPSNIMVDEHGLVKVLDFGLAKLTERMEPENFGPTQTMNAAQSPRTEEGTVLGTVAYMSPEQAEAKPVDVRSDIFSFGSMLYEMVTGQRAFSGDSRLSALSAILKDEPKPLGSTAPDVPRDLEKIIMRCLRKDPARRFQHMDDVKVAQEELKEESDSGRLTAGRSEAAPPADRARRLAMIASLAVLLAAVGGIAWRLGRAKRSEPAPALTRLTSDAGLTAYPALSADGTLLAYASDREGGTDSESRLDIWVQQIGGGSPLRLTHDPADAREPNFSPDGTKIVFRSERAGGGIYTVPALGGEERLVAEQGRTPRYSPDGKWIAYWTGDPSHYSRCKLFVIPAAGGSPLAVQADFYSARYPTWSPDSRHLLFLGSQSTARAEIDFMDWWVTPLDGGPATSTGAYQFLERERALPLINQSLGGYWVGDWIVFAAGAGFQVEDSSNLWRIPISPSGQLEGTPQRLTASTALDYQPAGILTTEHRPLIVFTSGGEHPAIWSLPVKASEGKVTGPMERLTTSAAEDSYPSTTPDGSKMVFISSRSGNPDIWMKDLVTGKESPLTSTSNIREAFPLISPDGAQVAYSVLEESRLPTYVIPTRGGVPKEIGGKSILEVQCWTPDSKKLVHRKSVTGHAYFIAIDPNTRAETPLLKHSRLPVAAPRFSPDGRWLVFQTIISSVQRQLFIAPLHDGAAGDEKEWIPITDGSGLDRNAAWSLDGAMLYFLSERDGWRCFWGQKLDPATKHPVGPAFAVQHFHQARHSLLSLNEVGAIGLSLGRDRIYFSMPEITGNIWMAKFE